MPIDPEVQQALDAQQSQISSLSQAFTNNMGSLFKMLEGIMGANMPPYFKGFQPSKGENEFDIIAGPPGPQGAQGIKGETGDTGLQGVPGPQGEKGDPGIGVTITGAVATESDLASISNPEDGDSYITADTGLLYVWDSDNAAWLGGFPFQGPQGNPGPQGQAGLDGNDGYSIYLSDAALAGNTEEGDPITLPSTPYTVSLTWLESAIKSNINNEVLKVGDLIIFAKENQASGPPQRVLAYITQIIANDVSLQTSAIFISDGVGKNPLAGTNIEVDIVGDDAEVSLADPITNDTVNVTNILRVHNENNQTTQHTAMGDLTVGQIIDTIDFHEGEWTPTFNGVGTDIWIFSIDGTNNQASQVSVLCNQLSGNFVILSIIAGNAPVKQVYVSTAVNKWQGQTVFTIQELMGYDTAEFMQYFPSSTPNAGALANIHGDLAGISGNATAFMDNAVVNNLIVDAATGTSFVPTAPQMDNSNTIANTAYVDQAAANVANDLQSRMLSTSANTPSQSSGPFASWAALLAGPYYYGANLTTPTNNDIAIFIDSTLAVTGNADITSQYRARYDGTQWINQYKISVGGSAVQVLSATSYANALALSNANPAALVIY